MAKRRTQGGAIVGVAEHASSPVLVTVAADGEVLDRRSVELIDRGLSTHPHHREGSWAVGRYLTTRGASAVSLADAVELVERVRMSAARGARRSLAELAATVRVPIAGIAIRACPVLPATTEERIADNRAQTIADSVMYREALATAAVMRGWSVDWYDRDRVFQDASTALRRDDVDAFLRAMGRSVGPPWQARHKLAAAAALAAKRRAWVFLVLMALALVACHPLSEGAQSDFSRSFTCPMDRVEVRARPELHPSDWFKPRTPPSEVASDPGRLRMWQNEQEKLRASADTYHSIYEARGCGHHALYECGRSTRGSSNSVICSERTYPSGVSSW